MKNRSTYNGYTLEQVEKMPFKGWIEAHKRIYIENCKRVIQCLESGLNRHDIELCKNENFLLVKMYLQ